MNGSMSIGLTVPSPSARRSRAEQCRLRVRRLPTGARTPRASPRPCSRGRIRQRCAPRLRRPAIQAARPARKGAFIGQRGRSSRQVEQLRRDGCASGSPIQRGHPRPDDRVTCTGHSRRCRHSRAMNHDGRTAPDCGARPRRSRQALSLSPPERSHLRLGQSASNGRARLLTA